MSLFLPVSKWEVRAMKPLSPELLNAYTKALGPRAATPAERGQGFANDLSLGFAGV